MNHSKTNPRRGRQENPVKLWYDEIPLGKFSGNAPDLQWVGPDMWLMHPDADFPFAFTRSNGEEIIPGKVGSSFISFSTDGGSTEPFNSFPNLTKWGYGGAYLIHDWIWYLHSRNKPTYSFQESNQILVEAIKTLIEKGYIGHESFGGGGGTVRNVWRGVQSPFARHKWDNHNAER